VTFFTLQVQSVKFVVAANQAKDETGVGTVGLRVRE